MGRLIRRRCRSLLALLPVALLLVACSGAAGDVAVGVPTGNPAAPITMNVYVTDDGFQPSAIQIPVGHTVQIVLRNLGTTEHHFRVQGLIPGELSWLSTPEDHREAGVSDADHQHHHAAGFVPWRGTSPHGIKPTGHEVHAYASPALGPMDVVLFTATNTGTFIVQCPLHPEITGKVMVSS